MEAMRGVFGKPIQVSKNDPLDGNISGTVSSVAKKAKHGRRDS